MRQNVLIIIMKLILLLIFFVMANGYNRSTSLTSKNLVRHKRDDSPKILHIKYHNHDRVELVTLKKVEDSTLVNSKVPIRDFEEAGGESEAYRLDHVEPIFYHGVNSFAAITYFPHTNTLYGVIDNRFYIEDLPLEAVGKPEIVDAFTHKIPERSQKQHHHRAKRMDHKRKSDDQAGPSSSKRFKEYEEKSEPRKILYPEILLTVDVSSRINPRLPNQYEEAIMYVLSYWNAVDMLFRNLKRVDVRINIAGILIGTIEEVIPNVVEDSSYHVDDNLHPFILDKIALDSLGTYFYGHTEIKRDSFDFLFWMTRASLIEGDEAQGRNDIFGIAAPPEKCGGRHQQEHRITNKITNRAVFQHDDKYGDFQWAARELAHLMFVYNDDVEVKHGRHNSNCLSSNPMQSSGIMDPSNKRLDGCLMWSYCSEIHFENYANSKSSCCLLNFPYRSLGLSYFIEPLTVKRQCDCYELHESNPMHYQGNICSEPLKCINEHGHTSQVALPLDGTPCVKHVNNGFCKEGYCLSNIIKEYTFNNNNN